MRIPLIILKAISILFAGLPLAAVGVFFLLGGPDPGGGGVGIARIIALLFLAGVCFFILPNRILIRWKFSHWVYMAFCILAVYIFLFIAKPSYFNLPNWVIMLTIAGLICGALSLFIAINENKGVSIPAQ